MSDLKYPHVLLKLSGEALAGDQGTGFDFDTMHRLADEVKSVFEAGATAPDLRREAPVLQRALRQAVRAFAVEREREGRHLATDMRARTARQCASSILTVHSRAA